MFNSTVKVAICSLPLLFQFASCSAKLSQLPKIKVAFFGPVSSGKTSLVHRWITGKPLNPTNTSSTIGVSLRSEHISDPKTPHLLVATLEIWDTAGQERYNSLVPIYTRHAHVAIFVCDMTLQQSFDEMIRIYYEQLKHLPENCLLFTIWNKCDLITDEIAELPDIRSMKNVAIEKGLTFYITSALSEEVEGRFTPFEGVKRSIVNLILKHCRELIVNGADNEADAQGINADPAARSNGKAKLKRAKTCCS